VFIHARNLVRYTAHVTMSRNSAGSMVVLALKGQQPGTGCPNLKVLGLPLKPDPTFDADGLQRAVEYAHTTRLRFNTLAVLYSTLACLIYQAACRDQQPTGSRF
jgi:hypothetical protein